VPGLAVFAAIMMLISGAFEALSGLVGLFDNGIYVVGPRYLYSFDLNTWGWIHLLVGVLLIVAGAAVLSGQLWGRIVGILFAGLSMLASFLSLPYYPFWSLLIIALDVFVIWALCIYDRDVARS